MQEVTEENYKRSTTAQFTTVKPVGVMQAVTEAMSFSRLGSDRIDPNQMRTGSYYGQQQLGGDKVLIDSSGGRIIISDDTNTPRFLAGART